MRPVLAAGLLLAALAALAATSASAPTFTATTSAAPRTASPRGRTLLRWNLTADDTKRAAPAGASASNRSMPYDMSARLSLANVRASLIRQAGPGSWQISLATS